MPVPITPKERERIIRMLEKIIAAGNQFGNASVNADDVEAAKSLLAKLEGN